MCVLITQLVVPERYDGFPSSVAGSIEAIGSRRELTQQDNRMVVGDFNVRFVDVATSDSASLFVTSDGKLYAHGSKDATFTGHPM